MKLSLSQMVRSLFFLTVAILAVFGIGALLRIGENPDRAVLNIFPTIFDQFGLVDLLFLSLNLTTLIILVVARKEFLPA